MTLEDFFTLAEMKDGLTAPSRVQELVSVMQKEKDFSVKNVGDATRQWASVGSTIVATENKDCLDLFIQLDGLCFIDSWLQDAQKFGVDTNDSFIEESIVALLRAVERLHVDYDRSISSGIWVTVRNLLGHHSSKVQDKARVLFDNWKVSESGDADHHAPELASVNNETDKLVREEDTAVALDITLSKECGHEENHASGLAGSEKSPVRSTDGLQPERVSTLQIQSLDHQLHSPEISDCPDLRDGTVVVESSISSPEKGSAGRESNVIELNGSSKDEKQEHKVNSSPERLGEAEISSASNNLEPGSLSLGVDAASSQLVCQDSAPSIGVWVPTSEQKSGEEDMRAIRCSSPNAFKTAKEDGDCFSNALQESFVCGSKSGKFEELETSFSRIGYGMAVDVGEGHHSDDDKDITNGFDSFSPAIGGKSSNMLDKNRSDTELEYGLVDALEVARQVAKEVEREVVDRREPFCSSSSERISDGGIRQPGSPDSIGNRDLHSDVPVPSRLSDSADEYHEGDGHVSSSDSIETEPKGAHDVESSEVTEGAQEAEGNSEKSLCDFDLNEEVCSDDIGLSVNEVSIPIPVVSASRPAVIRGLPKSPLQFEGALGWKGSAVTSAFHPASPRKTSDGDKFLSIGGTCVSSKRRQDFLDIDLNLTEGEDGSVKQIAAPSGLPSGESSLDVSPKRLPRLKLDLNIVDDDGDGQASDLRMEGQIAYNQNGHSPSPASSASSMQPFIRNIDLNDRPYLHNDFVDRGPGKSSSIVDAYGRAKSDAPFISILGARVEVNTKEFVPQTLPLPNGKTTEPEMDLTMARAGGILGMGLPASFTHSPVFGYNGMTPAPTMSFSSTMYGSGVPIPYMVDSRGAPVLPQIMGSASTVLPSYSQSPFIMSMSGTQLTLNGASSSRPNFDLNSGYMVDGGSRDTLNMRQFLIPGQGRSFEDHLRTIPQPSSSGVGGKRKEPDSGLETYPFSYKHQQPSWK
ncbi:IIS transcription factor [Quillaja saponaria]|uniref:IIS transcription factor n=1 Tax=Quillaja saponaria TaxID=32244 RepID=A0AAD7PSS8_QUISA|nr:IIS transcription factor [Quillaja saponaria]